MVTEVQVTQDEVTEASEDLLPVDEGYDATFNDNDLNVRTLILEQVLLDRFIQESHSRVVLAFLVSLAHRC
jgi:hypothetical protein